MKNYKFLFQVEENFLLANYYKLMCHKLTKYKHQLHDMSMNDWVSVSINSVKQSISVAVRFCSVSFGMTVFIQVGNFK